MLVLEWKERAFIEKVNSRCFLLIRCTNMASLYKAPYKGAWDVSSNNSESMGHKDLRLGQIVSKLYWSFITVHFLGFFHWAVSNLVFCCVTVKTIYSECCKPCSFGHVNILMHDITKAFYVFYLYTLHMIGLPWLWNTVSMNVAQKTCCTP